MWTLRGHVIVLCTVIIVLCSAQQHPLQQPQPLTSGFDPAAAAGDSVDPLQSSSDDEPPEGYYAFIESPSAVPPKVRPPPYTHVKLDCKELHSKKSFVSVHNLCGDLNKGQIPRNPMQQNVLNEPYPFELIRNQTLRFLSKTLPVLKADDTLPKVTQIQQDDLPDGFDYASGIGGGGNRVDRRMGRALNVDAVPQAVSDEQPLMQPTRKSVEAPTAAVPAPISVQPVQPESRHSPVTVHADEPRVPRKFCDGGGVFCTLYRAINGDSSTSAGVQQQHHQLPVAHAYTAAAERREEIGPAPPGLAGGPPPPRYDGPPTPCPAKVEYATPVFAKNYQGSWRYVVQIPYEGYFTQTVEVTRCLQARCHYLDGGCLSSPRWVSLLVAEIFYPNADDYAAGVTTTTSTTTTAPPVQDFQAYQQYLQRRAGLPTASDGSSSGPGAADAAAPVRPMPHCDGHDEIGCFQVRLYYDWFLIPGSCKCWRPDYFARYVRRKPGANGADL